MSNVSLYTQNLYQHIRSDIQNSTTIYLLSSFIMESGVKLILDDLREALNQGADVKILTGDYLYITQPKALIKLLELSEYENFELRLWQSSGHSFHPKTYLFKHKEQGALVVGSSNLSRSAFTSGVEWNLRMERSHSTTVFHEALNKFIEMFYSNQTIEINHETIKEYGLTHEQFHAQYPNLNTKWTKQEEIELTLPTVDEVSQLETTTREVESRYREKIPEPRPAQKIALDSLSETVDEGYNKAVVALATGLGKTYLAAFFSKQYSRVLFIAHREEILNQARQSFEHVLEKPGGIYNGTSKEKDKDIIFASVQTLSIQERLESFDPNEFDLIIVDEFHHAAANTYTRVINYFKPEFLLGLTATPERTDGQDVLALCDGNLACEISFIDAIRHGWLSPFQYYGVLDDIDYSEIRWLGTQYDKEQLTIEQLQEDRASYIYQEWLNKRQTRTIGFCSTIKQAEFLAQYFKKQGVEAISLTGQSNKDVRKEVIGQLERLEVEIIFTVDLFNEGVDIPSVDTLLFARPTESLVVFTQQVGRGLRTLANKDYCVIIDLIGNYRNAETKLMMFNDSKQPGKTSQLSIEPVVPTSCSFNLETEVINLIEELKRKASPLKEKIYLDYLDTKKQLGRRPSYKEAHLSATMESKLYKTKFGGYFAFLKEFDELSSHEEEVFNKHFHWLSKVEKETMSKSYKMVILQYLLEKGSEEWTNPITPKEVAPYFHNFYMEKNYRKHIDFSDKANQKLWEYDERKVSNLIAKMPMTKWTTGNDNLATFDDAMFQFNIDIDGKDEQILFKMTREICDYKMHTYFERRMDRNQ
ncbi:DEAD/DEAH box helicase family protein [Alkalibacillus silvisoli]|uniref:DEAD/DEAH box helicase family protein n=1 Tax=Alkalibacillus silvisoli TaxID=392823 RepID=A0ABP3JXI3_9BACI